MSKFYEIRIYTRMHNLINQKLYIRRKKKKKEIVYENNYYIFFPPFFYDWRRIEIEKKIGIKFEARLSSGIKIKFQTSDDAFRKWDLIIEGQ